MACWDKWDNKRGKNWKLRSQGISENSQFNTGERGHNFLELKSFELEKNFHINPGFEFFVPFQKVTLYPKDFFAISEEEQLQLEINNMINHPFQSFSDSIVSNIPTNSRDYSSFIYNKFQLAKLPSGFCSPFTRIIAFRFGYRLLNGTYDADIYKKLAECILRYKPFNDHLVISSTNIFCGYVTFLVSNITDNKEIIKCYKTIPYYDSKPKVLSTNIYEYYNKLNKVLDSIYIKYLIDNGVNINSIKL